MAMAVAGSSVLLVAWRRRYPPEPQKQGESFCCGKVSCGDHVVTSRNQVIPNYKGVTITKSVGPSCYKRKGKCPKPLKLAVYSDSEADDGNRADKAGSAGRDQVVRCISTAAEVSILTLVATNVVHEAQQRHKTSPTASAALGRALMGTLLLGAMKGANETVQITFLGQGPLGQMTTVASGANMVKGFVGNPLCQPPLKSSGKLDVGSAVGTGILTVVRNNPTRNQPYSGTIPIYSGEVAEDIAHYLADSEQLNVALGLGVSFNRDTSVKFAGGFLVQVLPFCSDETLMTLENNILTMPPLSDSEGISAQEITEYMLKDIGVGDYSELSAPSFGPCTVEELKPRMVRAVASLGLSDVKEILAEQGHVEVRCEFCAEVVRFDEADLQDILHPN